MASSRDPGIDLPAIRAWCPDFALKRGSDALFTCPPHSVKPLPSSATFFGVKPVAPAASRDTRSIAESAAARRASLNFTAGPGGFRARFSGRAFFLSESP